MKNKGKRPTGAASFGPCTPFLTWVLGPYMIISPPGRGGLIKVSYLKVQVESLIDLPPAVVVNFTRSAGRFNAAMHTNR